MGDHGQRIRTYRRANAIAREFVLLHFRKNSCVTTAGVMQRVASAIDGKPADAMTVAVVLANDLAWKKWWPQIDRDGAAAYMRMMRTKANPGEYVVAIGNPYDPQHTEHDYDGHVVALTASGILLDASIDQATRAGAGIAIPVEGVVAPIDPRFRKGHGMLFGRLRGGVGVIYWPRPTDRSFITTKAWANQDWMLDDLARRTLDELRKEGHQVPTSLVRSNKGG